MSVGANEIAVSDFDIDTEYGIIAYCACSCGNCINGIVVAFEVDAVMELTLAGDRMDAIAIGGV
jgi:hypothetical protein